MKKEDLARGLLNTLVLDIMQVNHTLAHFCKVKHVFFCGSFVQHHLVREEIAMEWMKADVMAFTANPLMVCKCQECGSYIFFNSNRYYPIKYCASLFRSSYSMYLQRTYLNMTLKVETDENSSQNVTPTPAPGTLLKYSTSNFNSMLGV